MARVVSSLNSIPVKLLRDQFIRDNRIALASSRLVSTWILSSLSAHPQNHCTLICTIQYCILIYKATSLDESALGKPDRQQDFLLVVAFRHLAATRLETRESLTFPSFPVYTYILYIVCKVREKDRKTRPTYQRRSPI